MDQTKKVIPILHQKRCEACILVSCTPSVGDIIILTYRRRTWNKDASLTQNLYSQLVLTVQTLPLHYVILH